uniref:Auxin response factor 2 n=1 Tax=Solanum tuberosum TaxID=4113 RepID=M1D4W7_SOLTU
MENDPSKVTLFSKKKMENDPSGAANIPLFWSFFTFKPHFKPHPDGAIVFQRVHILIIWDYKLSRACPIIHK